MVIAFSLYAISAYKQFHRNTVHSDSGGNWHISLQKVLFNVLDLHCVYIYANNMILESKHLKIFLMK